MTPAARTGSGRRRELVALAGLLAAGCLGPPAPRDRYFRLELAPPARLATAPLPGILEVERPGADAVVRRTALVWVADASAPELHTRAYEHWADSPTLLVQREIVAYLQAAGVAARVVTPQLGIDPEHRLTADLVRFEERRGDSEPRVVVELALALIDLRTRSIRLQRSYREEQALEGSDAEAAVRAYDAALSAVLGRFVADLGARP